LKPILLMSGVDEEKACSDATMFGLSCISELNWPAVDQGQSPRRRVLGALFTMLLTCAAVVATAVLWDALVRGTRTSMRPRLLVLGSEHA
jgi:hypothetical protein